MSSKSCVLDLFLVRNSFRSLPCENYDIKDTKVCVYLIAVIAVIVLKKNSHKSPLGASFYLMALMYSLKTEMISLFYRRLSAIIVYGKRKGEREPCQRFMLWSKLQAFNLRMSETDHSLVIVELPVSCARFFSHPPDNNSLEALLLYKQYADRV